MNDRFSPRVLKTGPRKGNCHRHHDNWVVEMVIDLIYPSSRILNNINAMQVGGPC
jgi:hypothetical protein